MSVKILEKRKTATERIVVYEVGGERKSISRPSFVSFDKIVEEAELLETPTVRSVEKRSGANGTNISSNGDESTEDVSVNKNVSRKSSGRKTEIKIEE